jgi:glycosyltransferase involved in cell wall biosynthesis
VRIAFNAQLLSYGQWYRSAGISRYIDRTLVGLARFLPSDSMIAFVGPDVLVDAPALRWLRLIQTHLPTYRPLARIVWEQTVLPVALRRLGIDLLHAPAYVAPLVLPCPSVVTFHDLSFYLLPDAFNRQNRIYLRTLSRLTAKRARRVIAVSEATRQDLVHLLDVDPTRIDVVYNGVDERFRPEANSERLARFRRERGLPEQFILYLGTLEPRKNIPTLLRAYAAARQRGLTAPLVLAGGRGWRDQTIEPLIEELGMTGAVRLVGFVPMDEQVLWYNAATLFAFPSRYEGFGFPVLEAMACGTPVVASNRSALPEVVGDAGVLVDPDEPEALAEVLVSVVHDDAWREDLARRGRQRAEQFTWDEAARATFESYRRALDLPRLTPTIKK